MSRSMNKAILLGNLGADPEVRSTSNGRKVATFSLATSRQWKNVSGEAQEKTEWHKCVAWNGAKGGLADVIEKYVGKGDKVLVEGRIEYREYEDKDKQRRYVTEVNVTDLLMLGGPGAGSKAVEPQIKSEKPSAGYEDFPSADDLDSEMPF